MSETDDHSANVTPLPGSEDSVVGSGGTAMETWDSASAEPASAMAAWRALEQARAEAQELYESQIEQFKTELEQKVGPIDSQLEAIEEWFLNHAATTGADSFDSDAGKVSVSVRETPKITDAESFFSWAAESNNVGLLQKRISVTQFREFAKANPDQTPPGVTIEAAQSIKFKPAD